MKHRDDQLANQIRNKLQTFSTQVALLGIENISFRECFIAQLVDSVRRIQFVQVIDERDVAKNRADPTSIHFDPLRASILYKRSGDVDEAFWLVFLSVLIGKNKRTGWRLTKDIYGGKDNSVLWSWQKIVNNLDYFLEWLEENKSVLMSVGKFGNHRKYQNTDAYKNPGIGVAIKSYIQWVGPQSSHELLVQSFQDRVGENARKMFHEMYKSVIKVSTFGRMGAFDFLTMIGKLGLANIEPGSTYLRGATGPVPGAKLLLTADAHAQISIKELELFLDMLEKELDFPFGMQVLEDALCNWQKRPDKYLYFNG